MTMRNLGRAVVSGLAGLVLCAVATAQQSGPVRPRITGISNVGYFVSDLPRALVFWHDLLGFDEPYSLPKADGQGVRIAFVKINDHQHVELFHEPSTHPPSMMNHLSLTVDDVDAMRTYLRAKGIEVTRGSGAKTRTGDKAFEVHDPDGTLVEFVQTLPDSMESKAKGTFAPETRVSSKIYHVGFPVGNSAKAMDFYGNVLGFKETWRGGADPKVLSWINMRVPDGSDYVEFMLYTGIADNLGGRNHIALSVPHIYSAEKELRTRPAFQSYGREMVVRTGVNQKRQMNLFDPDGTRVELMEETTITGKPTPPSTAPPPAPAHL